MQYKLSLLATKGECQLVLDDVLDLRTNLQLRKTSLSLQLKQGDDALRLTKEKITAVTKEISVVESLVPGLPEGSTKENAKSRITKGKYAIFLEQERMERLSSSVLKKGHQLKCTEQTLATNALFIRRIMARIRRLDV